MHLFTLIIYIFQNNILLYDIIVNISGYTMILQYINVEQNSNGCSDIQK